MRNLDRSRRRRLLGPASVLAVSLACLAWPARWTSAATPVAPTWSSVSPASSPPPLAFASMAYDSDNNTLVLFGGQTTGGALSSATWIWNGSSWSQVASPVPARSRASMAFDPQLHQLILFGGVGADGQARNDTWAWNGASWYPEDAQDPAQAPPARQGASLALDAAGQLVLFGGTGSSAATNAATNDLPAPASGTSSSVLGDTWAWTGRAWSQQGGTGPPARTDAAMAWDPSASRSVLFGGSSAPSGTTPPAGLLGDSWVWGSGSWTPAAPGPPPTEDLSLAGDPDLGGVVGFGGATGSGLANTTWLWDGTTWTTLNAPGAPAPRQGAAAAYDTAAHQLVLYGGVGADGGLLGDTEVLTARAPTTAVPTPTAPTSTANGPSGGLPTGTTTLRRAGGPGSTGMPASSTTTTGATSSSPTPPTAPRQLHPGQLMTLRGSGFQPGAAVTITFHSAPYLVGRTVASTTGTFAATIAVPTSATAGLHHFEAAGAGAGGAHLLLGTPVQVVLLAAHHDTLLQTLLLVAISVALPAGCWMVMELRSRRRSPAEA